MRTFKPGCPARSLAGHDKDQYYIILSDEKETVLLVDGRGRPLARPKRKNKKHIQVDQTPLFAEFPVRDHEIYSRLKNYRKCHSRIQEV